MSSGLRLAGDVGLQTEDGFHRMLSRGSRLPKKARVTLRTGEDDQSSLEFTIIQRLGPVWSSAFRQARIDGLPAGLRGSVKIRFEIEVDAEGALAARVRVPGRKGTTVVAEGRVETATREGLARATRPSAGIGLVERGILPAGEIRTPADPLRHPCEHCGQDVIFRAISTISPPADNLTCGDCGDILPIPALDNMAGSFFQSVPGGRLSLAVAPASVEIERSRAHVDAQERLEEALRPCPCGGRFSLTAPARCPGCRTPFVTYGDDIVFRLQQPHVPLVEGAKVLKWRGARPWTRDHLRPFEADVRLGPLRKEGAYVILPIDLRNRDGWLIVPMAYALVLRGADGREFRAFRPVPLADDAPLTPEAWQATQSEADAAYVAEILQHLGLSPLIDRVDPDETISGTAVFPADEMPTGPLMLVIGHTLELPLA
jgi:hypothetical protein